MPGPDRIVELDGVEHHFPSDASDAEISAVLKAIPATNATGTPAAKTWSPALPMATAGKVIPVAANAAVDIAANPSLAPAASTAARTATTLASVIKGAATMNPAEVLAAPKYGWAAGKGAYWLTKGAQAAAAPIAATVQRLAPYAQTLSTLSGAQAVNDLAQAAEPDRKDIGVLGMAPSREIPKEFTDFLAGKASARDAIKALMDAGWSQGQATRAVMNQKVKG